MKRGVLVKGHVTDAATGQPVQAFVQYFAFADNPGLRDLKGFDGSQAVSSKQDGSFALAALPGPGIVAVRTDDMRRGKYVYGKGIETFGRPAQELGGHFQTSPYLLAPWQFDTVTGINPGAKTEQVTCDLQLYPGKTVKGTVLDPDGRPLAGVDIRGPFGSSIHFRDLPSATFMVPAIDPSKPEAYFFEHAKKKLAAGVILKGDEAEGFPVKLKAGAAVTGRLVTTKGEAVPNARIRGNLEAGQLNMTDAFRGFFWESTDGEGRFKIEGLLPEVKLSAVLDDGSSIFANLILKAGETRNLGDIRGTILVAQQDVEGVPPRRLALWIVGSGLVLLWAAFGIFLLVRRHRGGRAKSVAPQAPPSPSGPAPGG